MSSMHSPVRSLRRSLRSRKRKVWKGEEELPCYSKDGDKDKKRNDHDKKDKRTEEERLAKEEVAKIIRLRDHPVYRTLCERIATLEKKRKYRKRRTPNPGVRVGNYREKVYWGIANETVCDWEKRAEEKEREMRRKRAKLVWPVDDVISSEERAIGSNPFTEKVLEKFEGFPVPSWEDAKTLEGKVTFRFALRQRRLDFVEFFLRQMMGDADFKKEYPLRYLTYEKGRGSGGYIKDPRAMYKNKLRAIERHFNKINRSWGLPPVLIEDWTRLELADETLRNLVYIQQSIITTAIQTLLDQHPDGLKHIRCSEKCRGTKCGHQEKGKVYFCCGQNDSIELGEDGVPAFIWSRNPKPFRRCRLRIECTNDCCCDPKKCSNRSVQRGRQHPLLIFRDHKKGWSLRCLTEIGKDEFVAEYCGEAQLESSTDDAAQPYDFDLTYHVDKGHGVKGSITICSHKQGNETRWLSHSCSPNIYSENTVIERHGLFFNTVAFRANRKLTRGEELAFDYFNGAGLDACTDYSKMFKYCFCGSPVCRFTFEKVRAFKLSGSGVQSEK